MEKKSIKIHRKKKKKVEVTGCHDCDECIYICEGDYICGVNCEIILTDFSSPTDSYMWCNGKHFVNEM